MDIDALVKNPSRVRYLDTANGLLAFFSLIFLGIAYFAHPSFCADFLLNLAAGAITVPLIYFFARFLFYDPNSPTIIPFSVSDEDYFLKAQKLLSETVTKNPDTDVRIYAPVGIWFKNEGKDSWLKTLRHLAKEKKIYLKAVFALPPGDEPNNLAMERLRSFQDKPSVEIHYLPPTLNPCEEFYFAAPGLGIIIINEDQALFGFSAKVKDQPVSTGYLIKGEKAVKNVVAWFDSQVWPHEIGSHMLISNGREMDIYPQEHSEQEFKRIEVLYATYKDMKGSLKPNQ